MSDAPEIRLPNLCRRHALSFAALEGRRGAWQLAMSLGQVATFHYYAAANAERLSGDTEKLALEVARHGCLACREPHHLRIRDEVREEMRRARADLPPLAKWSQRGVKA